MDRIDDELGDGCGLMIPGPAALSAEQRLFLGSQTIPHYDAPWLGWYAELRMLIGELVDSGVVYVVPGSGSLAIEMGISNLFEPTDLVLVPDTGYFGRRLALIAGANGLRVDMRDVPIGEPADTVLVEECLRTGRYAGVLMVHVETSTGVRHPIREVARLCQDYSAICLVDGVASVGAEELFVETWGVDCVATAPQKAIGGPPGFGIIALSARASVRVSSRASAPRSWYMDLRTWDDALAEGADWEPTPITISVGGAGAMLLALRHLLRDDREDVAKRASALRLACTDGLRAIGLRTVAASACQANGVIVVRTPNSSTVRDRLRSECGIVVARGLSPLEHDTIRIGLVGAAAHREAVESLLRGLANIVGQNGSV